MTQTAVVTKVFGPGLCEVRVRRASMCGDVCASCTSLCETPDIDVLAINREGAAPGDRVLIEGSRTLLLAALVYLVPIVLFFIGWFIHPIAGAAGVLTGVAGVFFVNRFLQDRGGVSAKIIAVIERAP
jgi:sigma-E factor negative regulatory protein RseC